MKSLTDELVESLNEARNGVVGPASQALANIFSLAAEFIFKSPKFEWNAHNWDLWTKLAQGEFEMCDHVVTLDAGWHEGIIERYTFVIAGPQSKSAPLSIGTGLIDDRKSFLKILALRYALDRKNTFQPNPKDVARAADEAKARRALLQAQQQGAASASSPILPPRKKKLDWQLLRQRKSSFFLAGVVFGISTLLLLGRILPGAANFGRHARGKIPDDNTILWRISPGGRATGVVLDESNSKPYWLFVDTNHDVFINLGKLPDSDPDTNLYEHITVSPVKPLE